ncbi:YbaK/EbsC family protein [Rhodobacteraceae bacterium XHP0102]|nr:YbaK/EbsC family protein [Rhodobacteraceae bacterium XHP0102]
MSKSLARVTAALADAGLDVTILEMSEGTRTAEDAARAAACQIDQIAKSIIFRMVETGELVLFITAGGNQVDPKRAETLTQGRLARADAETIRAVTGFAIGGVAPFGHLTPLRAWFDPRLAAFDHIYAAAGTPRHIFGIAPLALQHLSGAETAEFTL